MTAFTGTGALVRLILRRDRVLMPIWVLMMSLLPLMTASGTNALYDTDAERQGYIDTLGRSSLLVMFYGRIPGPSLGELIFWRIATGMLIMALIGLLVVIRHTRVEEEAGRRELIGSTVVGRYASLAAALLATTGACLTVAVFVALGMMSQHTPASGAIAMGLAWAVAGILFGAVGAVAAQLTESVGAARAIGIVALAAAFALRATGDVSYVSTHGDGASWVTWLSPLGWVYEVQAYQVNRWWVFAPILVLVLVLVATAFALSARRDLGAGLLPSRLGPAQAAPGLRTPLALAWRLHRGMLISCVLGFLVLGLLGGGVAQSAGDLFAGNQQLMEVMERLGGRSAASDVFIAGMLNGLVAIFVAAYAIAAALRMRTEEASLRSESVLATGVSRLGWAGSHLTFALLGPALGMAAVGLAIGLFYGAAVGDVGGQLPRILAGALVQLPAIWLLTGLTVAAFGILPQHASAVGWVALSACVILGQVGAALRLSQAWLDVSPFTHIPRLPGGDIAATPLLALTILSAALVAVGLVGLRRRDIPNT